MSPHEPSRQTRWRDADHRFPAFSAFRHWLFLPAETQREREAKDPLQAEWFWRNMPPCSSGPSHPANRSRRHRDPPFVALAQGRSSFSRTHRVQAIYSLYCKRLQTVSAYNTCKKIYPISLPVVNLCKRISDVSTVARVVLDGGESSLASNVRAAESPSLYPLFRELVGEEKKERGIED